MTRIAGETIDKAAILYEGVVYDAPRPARHHDVMRVIWNTLGDKPGEERFLRGETQGFVTSAGRFVRRLPAVRIAKVAGQIEAPKWPPELYSEDLW